MDLLENIRESIRSIWGNRLRSAITVATLAIGITCLVGMITAIEALRSSTEGAFSEFRANVFSIRSKNNARNRRRGIPEKPSPPLRYREVMEFKSRYSSEYGMLSVMCDVSGRAIVQRGKRKTYANVDLLGVDAHGLRVSGYDLAVGRNFTPREVEGGQSVAIIGDEVYRKIFDKGEDPLGSHVIVRGARYVVVGLLASRGASESGEDRAIAVPLDAGRRHTGRLRYQVDIQVDNLDKSDEAIAAARTLMRNIRRDGYEDNDSFDLVEMKAAQDRLSQQIAVMRIVGYTLGFITLLGACVGLMNIMLVYVQERIREIGLRKAIGATSAQVKRQFLTEAITICQIGGLLGILFGVLVGNIVSLLTGTSFIFPWQVAMLGLLVSFVVGVLAGYVPAKNAAAVDPIQSLRYE